MSAFRVIDRSTGEPVVGPDRQVAATPRPTPPSERPVVLPGAAASTVRGRTAVEVVVAGWQFEFEVEDADLAELRDRATGGRDAATHHGPTEVRAIIPGRVVSIVVVVGDEVTAGQRLLAVEAMKMENELRAPRDGTVERVMVSVGQTVELGDALVVIR